MIQYSPIDQNNMIEEAWQQLQTNITNAALDALGYRKSKHQQTTKAQTLLNIREQRISEKQEKVT